MSKYLDLDGLRYFFTSILSKFDGRYYKQSQVDALLNGKADADHNHDGRYYTEAETDALLALKAPLASPALTGTPTAPTASGLDTSAIANVDYVHSYITDIGNATQAKAGFMSATDKYNLDGTAVKTYSDYYATTNAQIGNNTACYVFNRRGDNAIVTFIFKLQVVEANIPANTTLISGLPKSSGINPNTILCSQTGDSVGSAYVTTSGNLVTAFQLTAGKTYWGSVTYLAKEIATWYDGN